VRFKPRVPVGRTVTLPPKPDPETVKMLAKVPIFASLKEKDVGKIAQIGLDRPFAAGQQLVKQGEKGIGFYLILSGTVEVSSGGKSLATLGPGQFFGEMALLDDQPRTADVVGTTAGHCLVVSPWEFWSFGANNPEVIRSLFQESVRRLRAAGKGFSE
jgi:CRP/FNR family transcriptional regulator, cyclic AMP receptor protein